MTTEHVAAALRTVDEEIVPIIFQRSQEQFGLTPTCSKGCFHCCKESVECSKAEAEYALEGIEPALRERVAARTRRWLTQVRAGGWLKERAPHARFWRMMNAWCPFLEDGLCSVYDRRPDVCRTFYALHDPAWCADDELRFSHQRFAQSPELTVQGAALMFAGQGWVANDHLGIWLAELLLGKIHPSASRKEVRVTLTPSAHPPADDHPDDPYMDAEIEIREA